MSAEGREVVRVENLVKDFRVGFGMRRRRVLADVSFSAFEGEIFSHVSREDFVRYMAGSLLTANTDGFNRNVYYYSLGAGQPLRQSEAPKPGAAAAAPGSFSRSWLQAHSSRAGAVEYQAATSSASRRSQSICQ